MATKMELVLSPGNAGGGGTDGEPFRNEDVREWSRVDRITGMLERARVETGRWRANTRDAAQSYGKMVDSRERNSADGSLVQKARRQVEIFQSQGTSGRSFQVVRASQWSSSRATDCGGGGFLDAPIISGKSTSQQQQQNSFDDAATTMNGTSHWRPSLEEKARDLEQLSCLCRKLHDEALSQSKFWPIDDDNDDSSSSSAIFTLNGEGGGGGGSEQTTIAADTETQQQQQQPQVQQRQKLTRSHNGSIAKSNSSEDLASLSPYTTNGNGSNGNCLPENNDDDDELEEKNQDRQDSPKSNDKSNNATFARDCKTRRSLQIITGSPVVAERARKFEEGGFKPVAAPRHFLPGRKSCFSSITDNDFVKNDPKHPSKLQVVGNNGQQQQQQVAKFSIQDGAQSNNQTSLHISSPIPARKPEPASPQQHKANNNNKTVVVLRNDEVAEQQQTRCVKSNSDLLTSSNGGGEYAMLVDATSAPIAKDENQQQQQQPVVNGNAKPVKKVEFCKTEIHFAPDSGKVNIVETDGKPPPTNKFRRRRRNNSLNGSTNGAQKSNLPLVHFGDTSYEKFIFGGQGKPTSEQEIEKTNGVRPAIDERWKAPEKSGIRDDAITTKDSYADSEHANNVNNKQRGAHTTTVNFLSSENGAAPKASEGGGGDWSLSPVNHNGVDDGDRQRAIVSRTTKITLHLPAGGPAIICKRHHHHHHHHHPRQLQLSPFAHLNSFPNLKSVRLVMSIGKEFVGLDRLFLSNVSLCNRSDDDTDDGCSSSSGSEDPNRGRQLWSLKLKDDESDEKKEEEKEKEGETIIDRSRMIEDKPAGNAYPLPQPKAHKDLDQPERRTSKAKVVTNALDSASPDNQVLLKVVTTHKPILARVVDNERAPPVKPPRARERSSSRSRADEDENDKIDKIDKEAAEAKDHCDKYVQIVNGDGGNDPTYENVFQAPSDDGTPLYENFQAVKTSSMPMTTTTTTRSTDRKSANSKRKVQSESSTHDRGQHRHGRVSSRASNSDSADRTVVAKTKGNENNADHPKRTHKSSSTRSNGSREGSIGKYRAEANKTAKEDGSRNGTNAKRKAPRVQEVKAGTPAVVKSVEKNNGSVRSKKPPVEVVYQTAVYNIKNENLNKPKVKEVKGPRLINELICGSKAKRPADKKLIKTAVVSQNTNKRKETPMVIKR